jgi:HNH endonuclease.
MTRKPWDQAPSRTMARSKDRAKTADRGYGWAWQKARRRFLMEHPLCVMCLPHLTAASVVDHIVPHKGDSTLFWDESNWQPLCKLHHDAPKQSFDRTGRMKGCNPDGTPVDPNHPWNKS